MSNRGRSSRRAVTSRGWPGRLQRRGEASQRRRWVLPVRIPGTRAVRDGALLPPPGHTVGSRTWDQFLTTQLRQQATTTA
jgi:hypothetical protein